MASSVLEGLARLCAERRRLFAKYRGYPVNSTHLLVVLIADKWVPIVLFGAGARPTISDEIFDPSWSVVPPAEPLYGGSAALGMCVEGDGGACTGSIGWNVMFNGHDALVTSRHIAVSNYSSPNPPGLMSVSSTPAGSAELVWSPVMESKTPAVFDIAIAEYVNGDGVRESICSGTAGYPTTFATDLDPAVDQFEFAGATTSCSKGSLIAVGDVLTDYTGFKGGLIWLQNQLMLDTPVDHGDSGSLQKRVGDNAIAGLNCARTRHHHFAVANPLFLIDWDVTPGGPADLPTVTPRNPVPIGVPAWKAPQPTVECVEAGSVRDDSIARLEWMLATNDARRAGTEGHA